MAPTRRRVLALLGGAATVLAEARAVLAQPLAASGWRTDDARYFAAYSDKGSPDFGIGPVDETSNRAWTSVVETRLHGGAVRPASHELVIVARRPGSFFLVIDARDGGVLRTIEALPGRHFYGHAVFSTDGHWLFTTEAAYETGEGLVGVYDVSQGYLRTAEWSSGGVGPHELVLAPDGASLWVANGGIDTHPDSGRATLNEGAIQSKLVRLDLEGRLAARYDLGTDLQSLSIRHIAVAGDGTLVFGCQDQADVVAARPLVGAVNASGKCEIVEVVQDAWRTLNGYVGSVAVDVAGNYLAATSPRGNRVMFQGLAGSRQTTLFELQDVCGVAAQSRPGEFLLTSGTGEVVHIAVSPQGARELARSRAERRWDNHIIRAASGHGSI